MLKLLKSNRDMSVNEVKLTLAIEDPRARERRESMGIEVRQMQCPTSCGCLLKPLSSARLVT